MGQTDKFLHFTATGWTAIGSIFSAFSILALLIFNRFYLREAHRSADAAETSLDLLRDQLALTQRPFVAIHSEYCEDISACLVWAHNQGNGPALDVEACLVFDDDDTEIGRPSSYSIGCLPIDGKFQFLIGATSANLARAVIWYKSITNEGWTTNAALIAGSPMSTEVAKGHLYRDGRYPLVKEEH
jgi:hypothetical protein